MNETLVLVSIENEQARVVRFDYATTAESAIKEFEEYAARMPISATAEIIEIEKFSGNLVDEAPGAEEDMLKLEAAGWSRMAGKWFEGSDTEQLQEHTFPEALDAFDATNRDDQEKT